MEVTLVSSRVPLALRSRVRPNLQQFSDPHLVASEPQIRVTSSRPINRKKNSNPKPRHRIATKGFSCFRQGFLVRCIWFMHFFFHTILRNLPPSYSHAFFRRGSIDFHGSLYIADRPCAWSSFAMLLATGTLCEAHYDYPVLILVVVCQFPAPIIPPGAHQVRTGVFTVPPSLSFY